MNMENTTEELKQKFFNDFNKRFGEHVLSIEMAAVRAGNLVFEKLNLTPQQKTDSLWGLLVFCKSKKVYFYVHPSESMMAAMIRVTASTEGPKEQVTCLSDAPGFKVVEPKRHWYDFLIPGSQFVITAKIDVDGKENLFEINCQNKASKVKAKF